MRKPVPRGSPHGDEEDKETGDGMDSDQNSLVSSSTFSMNIEEAEQEGEGEGCSSS